MKTGKEIADYIARVIVTTGEILAEQQWSNLFEEMIDEALAERDLLIYHVKAANKERGDLIEYLLENLQQVEEERDNLRILVDMAQGIPKN